MKNYVEKRHFEKERPIMNEPIGIRRGKQLSKKRIVIMRPLPIALLTFAIGLTAWFFFYRYAIWIYAVALSLTVSCFVFKIFDKKLFICCLIALFLSLEGGVYTFCFNKYDYLEQGVYSGLARVESVDSSGRTILTDVVLDGEELNGKILAKGIEAVKGDYVGFMGELITYDVTDKYQLHRIAQGVYYEINIDFYQYEYSSYSSVRDKIVGFIKDSFVRASDKDTANYLMSILFGESQYLDYQIKTAFTAVGVAHVFAVSGLHIGVLSGVLYFLCNKVLKINRNAIPFVLLPIFVFYSYLCNFSPSVIRASTTFLSSMFLLNFNLCDDKLSVFSLSALGSLIIKPVWLGDMSFLLSYGAVFGAYLLYPLFKKGFSGLNKSNKIGDALALNCSIGLSMIPLGCFFFSSVSLLNVVASFFIVPLTSVLYVLTIICLPLVFTVYLVKPIAYIAKLIVLLSSLTANSLAEINSALSFNIASVSLAPWYAGLFTLSPYCSLSPKRKSIVAGVFGLSCCLINALLF